MKSRTTVPKKISPLPPDPLAVDAEILSVATDGFAESAAAPAGPRSPGTKVFNRAFVRRATVFDSVSSLRAWVSVQTHTYIHE